MFSVQDKYHEYIQDVFKRFEKKIGRQLTDTEIDSIHASFGKEHLDWLKKLRDREEELWKEIDSKVKK